MCVVLLYIIIVSLLLIDFSVCISPVFWCMFDKYRTVFIAFTVTDFCLRALDCCEEEGRAAETSKEHYAEIYLCSVSL